MIEIAYLADHPEVIPTLAKWFQAQWPAYYAERTPADVAQDFYAEANHTEMPIRVIAFVAGALAGTITLREHALQDFPEYQPGLGGLFVVENHRGHGIGSALVSAGMQVASEQGYEMIFTATATANGMLERLGWQPVQVVSHGGEPLNIYCYDLDKSGGGMKTKEDRKSTEGA
jgi:GNAT superfamily N-acetyltransferase